MVLHIANHHFVRGLFAPLDGARRVGVRAVVRTVVEGCDDAELFAGAQDFWLLEIVSKLPVEIVSRDVQQRLWFRPVSNDFVSK